MRCLKIPIFMLHSLRKLTNLLKLFFFGSHDLEVCK